MEIEKVLKDVGLNEKEASVYLALLELGAASVLSIAQKAGIKRPTTYLILDDLQARGLVSEVPQSKKTLFVAESPEYLLSELSKRQEMLKRFLPDLLAMHNAKKEKPQVQLFQGKEGIRQVYESVFKAPEVLFFCTIQDVARMFPEVPKTFAQLARQKKVRVREILPASDYDQKYADTVEHDEFFQHRFLPAGMNFLTDNVIYGNNVAFFAYKPLLLAVVITSDGIVQSMKSLYELAWQSAIPYKK